MMHITISQEVLNKHLAFGLGTESIKGPGRRRTSCKQKLEDEITRVKDPKTLSVLNYLKQKLEVILIGTPEQLNKIIIKFNSKISGFSSRRVNYLYHFLQKVFVKDYEEFVDRKTGPQNLWCAYQYAEKLNVTICPYCNTQFVFYYNKNGRTRPVLDHFFDKVKHPFLAISIQNLVPCCKVCNSDFKGDSPIDYKDFLNPFEEGFGDSVFFEKKIPSSVKKTESMPDYLGAILGENIQYKIHLNDENASSELQEKVKNHNDLFHIEDLYDLYHKKYVNDLIIKARIYNNAYMKQLAGSYSKLFNSAEVLKQHLIPNDTDMNITMLSKLTKDILLKEIL
ncbi:hypothetical protein IBT50_02125 [Bacillus sp. S70]|uniref:hypothetical protein n=2 Tax=Bacillus TaxID=1386 RepID=UPI0019099B5F|nr:MULTISPECIES: hypothetical protein [unclassified Bacillus (in: firmicutes)]MBJ9978809.1 hypothetical protein [Bacillus sp. S29]MBK0100127.1 hypothetical protein [Bacillus sp. S70]MBK0106855.1 hypothetical protein [Bacillus sp. S73]MBK0135769.1 hypothetical protein [Bacillus sp. S72]MBK0156784.1 hypothetical protein [Bacillus sp. S71]